MHHPSASSRCSRARRTCSCTAPRSRATPASTRRGAPVILVSPRPLDLPDGLLVPAALLGIAALWSERRRLAAPLALLATIAASGIVFFVDARHRAPALPLFALFAAGGAAPLYAWMRRRPAMIGVAAALVMSR